MNEEARKYGNSWLGPVLGALVLVGGFVGYQEWRDYRQGHGKCVALKRQFETNMESMMGPATQAIEASKKLGNQLPMGSLSDRVGANQAVLDTLNAQCPGWMKPDFE